MSKKHLRRVGLIGLTAALAVLFFRDQQLRVQPEEFLVSSTRLPQAFAGFRIVQVSDLHGMEFGVGNQALLAAVRTQAPDLITITGDVVDQVEQLAMLPALARGLAAIAPTYYVTGNHEWAIRQAREIKTLMEENGVIPLTNSFVTLEREGETIVLAGVDDPNGPYDQKTATQLRTEITAAVGDAYTILLSHRDSVETYGKWGYDLVLCGHGHGGIIRIPILDQGMLSTGMTLFPEYDGGLYELPDGGACVVSRGLGSNTVPIQAFRLFNRPHLPVVALGGGA